LRFVNADERALEMGAGPYEAAELAASLRAGLVGQRESFMFETVRSDPVGARVSELAETARHGSHGVMVSIRIDSPDTSKQRVAMRVMQGGHDVPDEKLEARFKRTLANLERSIDELPVVVIFANTNLARPFQLENRRSPISPGLQAGERGGFPGSHGRNVLGVRSCSGRWAR